MAVDIYLFDRPKTFLKVLEHINPDTIELLTILAEKKQLKWASYIYYIGNTIFNQKQLPFLKKEIEQLKSESTLNQNDIDLILSTINQAQRNKSYYLMFMGE